MRIRILKDLENFPAGTEMNFVTWRNETDRSISGKLSYDTEMIHFDTGTFRRLDVFQACYTVEVMHLGLPTALEEKIMCDLEVSNDTHHNYDPEDEFSLNSWTKEVNQYLEDAGVPLDAKILLSFSW